MNEIFLVTCGDADSHAVLSAHAKLESARAALIQAMVHSPEVLQRGKAYIESNAKNPGEVDLWVRSDDQMLGYYAIERYDVEDSVG